MGGSLNAGPKALHAVGCGAQGPTWHLDPLAVTVLREN